MAVQSCMNTTMRMSVNSLKRSNKGSGAEPGTILGYHSQNSVMSSRQMRSNGEQQFAEKEKNILRWQHSPIPYDTVYYCVLSVTAFGVIRYFGISIVKDSHVLSAMCMERNVLPNSWL